MKTKYINPMNVMRLESAIGINGRFDEKNRPIKGTFNLPTIEEYNNSIKKNEYVGRKIDSGTDAITEPAAPVVNKENNKVEISAAAIEKRNKKVARAAAPKKRKVSAREKAYIANNKAMVAKTKAIAKVLKKQVKTGKVEIPAKVNKANNKKKPVAPTRKGLTKDDRGIVTVGKANKTNKKSAPIKKAAPKAKVKAKAKKK